MTPGQREQIVSALWPEGARSRLGVWAVLDCARDPKIYLALLESRLEFRCLYSGKLPRALEMVAPQLVELFPDSRLTARLLDEGWGKAWGVFLKIEDPSNLRHHLRKFLKVQDESGRALLFRYYDPRVMRTYLPTCTPAELDFVFGPVAQWLTESADGAALEQFERSKGVLRHARVPLRASSTPA
jgi:hypothetical protein